MGCNPKLVARSPKSLAVSPGTAVQRSFSNSSLYTIHKNSFFGPEDIWEEAIMREAAEEEENTKAGAKEVEGEVEGQTVVNLNRVDSSVCNRKDSKDNNEVVGVPLRDVAAAKDLFNATSSADEDDILAA